MPSIGADNIVSWVHRDDVVGMALEAIDNKSWTGPVNCTAPNPITQRELADTIASVASKFAFGLPEPIARLAFGDMVDILVGEQNIYPQRAVDAGYAFHFAHLTPALDDCIADS
jgi:hypothetical protein